MTFFFRFRRRDLRLGSGVGDPVTMGKVASGSAWVGDAGMGDTRGAAVDTGDDVTGAVGRSGSKGGVAADSEPGGALEGAEGDGRILVGIGRLEI